MLLMHRVWHHYRPAVLASIFYDEYNQFHVM